MADQTLAHPKVARPQGPQKQIKTKLEIFKKNRLVWLVTNSQTGSVTGTADLSPLLRLRCAETNAETLRGCRHGATQGPSSGENVAKSFFGKDGQVFTRLYFIRFASGVRYGTTWVHDISHIRNNHNDKVTMSMSLACDIIRYMCRVASFSCGWQIKSIMIRLSSDNCVPTATVHTEHCDSTGPGCCVNVTVQLQRMLSLQLYRYHQVWFRSVSD